MKTHTESEDSYIKALYHLGGDNPVSNGDLAQRIGAKGSSVTQAVKRLSQKNLVTVVPYKGVQLTEDGVLLAKSILRKHRLWETFLVDTLGFGWDQVHPLAEQLEHVQSEELVERLSEFLGAPKHDPHGDPIPKADGTFHPEGEVLVLAELNPLVRCEVKAVREGSDATLSAMSAKGIALGSVLTPAQIEALPAAWLDQLMVCKTVDDGSID